MTPSLLFRVLTQKLSKNTLTLNELKKYGWEPLVETGGVVKVRKRHKNES